MNKILAVAVILGSTITTSVSAADRWDLPTPYPDGNYHTENIRQFADEVAQATDGALEIVVHSNASLFKHPEIKRAVQTGQVPAGEVLVSVLSNEDPIYGVDAVPFLATNFDQARALWLASRPFIEKRLTDQGMTVLFAVPWPPQGIFSKTEINSVADLQGVKFRAYNAATSRLAELMAAIPTTVQAAEVPQAFSTGVVDAMVTSPATGVDSQAWDFVDYYYDTQAFIPKNIVIASRRALDRLDPSVRDAVMKAAASAEERGWATARKANDDLVSTLRDNGMTVVMPSDRLTADLTAIGETMIEEWATSAGSDGAELIANYRAR